MAHALVFDTLAYAEELQEAGVAPKVAKAQAKALAKVVDTQLATKRDLKELETNIRREIKEMEMSLKIWMGGVMATGIAILAALEKFF